MKKYLFYFLSHISAFTIGCYFVNEVRYNHRIEDYRWAFIIATLVIFVVAYHYMVYLEHKQEELDFTADEYYNAECHVFPVLEHGQKFWRYYFTDDNGQSDTSAYYPTKQKAVIAYMNRPKDERGWEPNELKEDE